MPKENKFEVEYAKSNMATCRVCMAKIPKDELRIGHVQVDGPILENDATALDAPPAERGDGEDDKRLAAMSGATRWHHFECFPRMKGKKWMMAQLPPKPDVMKGFAEVKKPDQKKLLQLWKLILGSQADAGAPGDDATGEKRKGAGSSGAPSAKRAKTGSEAMRSLTSSQGVLSNKQYKKVQQSEGQLAANTQAQLRAELQLNNQVVAGKKDELVRRVAEGRALGALPPCPRCNKGQLHFNRSGGWLSCPGYFDREAKVQKRCNFRTKEIKREKWRRK